MEIVGALQKDIEDIQSISIVPTILDVVCRATGMGFAAIARVTDETWVTCGVLDAIPFGLSVGDELEIETTFCKQVRESDKLVVIDHVEKDKVYHNHPIPAQYGFQSYISVPIVRKNGEFFGTLCALDPKPNKVNNPEIIAMFSMFTELIAFHLDALETMRRQDTAIKKKDVELATYDFISSHDLQEPLRKIQILTSTLEKKEEKNLSEKGKKYFKSIKKAATRMRNILNDLLTYSETEFKPKSFKELDLNVLVNRAKARLSTQLEESNAIINTNDLCTLNIVPIQMEQLFYNLFANSLSFRSDKRPLLIEVDSKQGLGQSFGVQGLEEAKMYCEITVKDNGMGFDQQYSEKIFDIFQRLKSKENDKSTGIGLSIVRRIVENHNGKIIAIGKPDHFAIFKIYLPL
ncbi:GAF domain-containing sensor histidine kinase [Zobellia russellii]|uniref:GAF domain-containing sensor histidine kinase n=1 Tax=Zobellia russellii TaxID=248907 RepID=UPI001BFF7ADD|nr:ATP-binding protein [Zobellia russellii]MBT9189214.1 GAF domain-containing protein [Zobellia russellii]